MDHHLSPRQVADALGVSESSVKRWCDRGRIPAERTVGGHRRLPRTGVLRFVRSSGQPLARPELLAVPRLGPQGRQAADRAVERVVAALREGDEERFRAIGLHLWLGGWRAATICDRVLAPAFHELGEEACGGGLDYRERRACEICLRLLHELGRLLPEPSRLAPLAIGGTLEGDWYTLPTTMVELALREVGFAARSYGASHPAATLAAAVADHRPRLVWISVSRIAVEALFVEAVRTLAHAAERAEAALVLGGRALTGGMLELLPGATTLNDLGELAAFATVLVPNPQQPPSGATAWKR